MTYVPVRDLPQVVQGALKSFGYHKPDVSLSPRDVVHLGGGGAGKGSRNLVFIVDLAENRIVRELRGSWGGINPFVVTVDNVEEKLSIPDNFVVILGTEGGRGSYANLYANTHTFASLLPEKAETLTDREQAALYCHKGIKSGAYRHEELARWGVGRSVVDSLVERGYLSRNKAGATAITLKGKNAHDGRSYFPELLVNGRY